MEYIYGPVKSRRLGLSLGVTLTPYKTCSFDCVYCQLGKTAGTTALRREYIAVSGIVNELRLWLQNNEGRPERLDYITVSGSGEPTLNLGVGRLIGEIKKISTVPVAVITNASLLGDAEVRRALLDADLIVPSLDAVTQDVFEKIDRPAEDIKIEGVINGLISLRQEFKGKLWLEVMVVKGVNDELGHIRQLREVIDRINPDKIQLNSPVRSPAEEDILSVGRKKLEKFKEVLGDKCEII